MNMKRGVLFLLALAAGVILITGEVRAGAKTKLDPESETFYKSAQLIMSSEEAKIWKRLPDAESARNSSRISGTSAIPIPIPRRTSSKGNSRTGSRTPTSASTRAAWA